LSSPRSARPLITPVYPALAEAWTRPVFAGSSAT